jgi:hypothetical protein
MDTFNKETFNKELKALLAKHDAVLDVSYDGGGGFGELSLSVRNAGRSYTLQGESVDPNDSDYFEGDEHDMGFSITNN